MSQDGCGGAVGDRSLARWRRPGRLILDLPSRGCLPVRLRAATVSDLPHVVAFERHPDTESFIIAWPLERHAAAMSDTDVRYLIIEEGRKPVGFLLVAGLAPLGDRIELRRIVVGQKGLGIGRAAIERLLSWAFAMERVQVVWLDVFSDNARALHLYESIGFRVVELAVTTQEKRALVIMEITRQEHAAR
jgi:diamine N-acetyltransferase